MLPKFLKFPNKTKKTLKLTKELKSLEDFRQYWIQWSFLSKEKIEDKNFIPCTNLECKGKGSYYDPSDEPDPIEGNKLRRRIKCKDCNGTGRGNREVFVRLYKQFKEKNKLERNKEIELVNDIQLTLNKLNSKDWENICLISRVVNYC